MNWQKTGRWIALVFGLLAISAVGLALGGGVYFVREFADAMCVDEEVARVTSPDGKVDALMIRTNCGAMASFTFRVYLVPKGNSTPDTSESIFSASNTEQSVQLRWIAHRRLHIEYKHANIYDFCNFWYHPDTTGGSGPLYEVRISEGVISPPAIN